MEVEEILGDDVLSQQEDVGVEVHAWVVDEVAYYK